MLAREGEIGREFFVVLEGEPEFTRKGVTLPSAQPAEFFGEVALIENTRRMATVTAKTPMRAFLLGEREFRQLLDANPRIERKVLRALARRLLSLVEAERYPTLT